jgi:hypothetical protein
LVNSTINEKWKSFYHFADIFVSLKFPAEKHVDTFFKIIALCRDVFEFYFENVRDPDFDGFDFANYASYEGPSALITPLIKVLRSLSPVALISFFAAKLSVNVVPVGLNIAYSRVAESILRFTPNEEAHVMELSDGWKKWIEIGNNRRSVQLWLDKNFTELRGNSNLLIEEVKRYERTN